ncbi:MAG: hypothetical protein ACOX8B_07190 [Lachnospiraceae bacterium]|jgi:hypothetical protein
MSFIDRLERRLGKYAIHNLVLILVVINTVGFALSLFWPAFPAMICWSMQLMGRGQIWRLITWLAMPLYSGQTGLFYYIIFIFLYYSIGSTLERAWGAFRLNVYVFTGILGHILGAVLVYLLFGYDALTLNPNYLYMSLFLGLALTYPDAQFLLYFIIPIKAKYLAIIEVIFLILGAVSGSPSDWVMIIMSLINVALFMFFLFPHSRFNPADLKRRREFRSRVREGEKSFAGGSGTTASGKTYHHKCEVCGRTDADYPNLEFRFCSKCDGAHEYCMDHLYTHKHIKYSGNGQNSADDHKTIRFPGSGQQ